MKREKYLRRFSAFVLSLLLLVSMLVIHAAAAEVTTVTVELRPDVTIVVDGTERTFYNVQGQEAHTIHYNGTHYLPVRAIGELMGKNVNWDQSTLTITLAGVRTTGAVRGVPDTTTETQNISVQMRPDFTIVVDNEKRIFTDEQGNAVYPMLHNGTTYLPVRAIGELMGRTVSWDGQTHTITLAASAGGSLVTDADSFDQAGADPQPGTRPDSSGGASTSDSYISEEKAKSIALEAAGVAASQVAWMRCHLDWDDGRWEYNVEFVSGTTEYEYEIDAYTGNILSRDVDSIYD